MSRRSARSQSPSRRSRCCVPCPSEAGRNNQGRITTRHQGGGHKRQYRLIDFKRNKFGVPARVASIEYDPNRSARIALLHYADGEKRYILAPNGLKVGDAIMSGPDADVKVGNALPLANIPVGSYIHNIELQPGRGGVLVRSAGVQAQLVAKEGEYGSVRMPSGEMRLIHIKLHGHAGTGREHRALADHDRQGRSLPPPGQASLRARIRHEPGGPPAWWRRGPGADRRPAADSVGQADAGSPHAAQQVHPTSSSFAGASRVVRSK